jgi:hypothetical protein
VVVSLNRLQESQTPQASPSGVGFSQLMVFARIRAQVVFPTPLGPQNKKLWAKWSFKTALRNVEVMDSCPTTSLNFCGLYFLAETIKLSMQLLI